VPPSHVLALVSSVGPTGKAIELTHSKRNTKEIIDEMYQSIYQIAKRVPHGMVVFFTSYAYMKTITDQWTYTKDSNIGESMMSKLKAVKEVFIEPRNATDSEKVWSAYKTQAQPSSSTIIISSNQPSISSTHSKGAILFCVIGGKLSEGINFSDELARCVVVVGLPYPDSRDPILQMKLQYTDSVRPNSNASSELYEAMCMKAVNQSIGRAIRHINDYSAIVLLDQRYNRPKTLQLLPGWISRNIACCDQFSAVQEKLTLFFQSKG
jgi:chromosome transmission fidelity protein 1